MPFLPPNQQRRITEGRNSYVCKKRKKHLEILTAIKTNMQQNITISLQKLQNTHNMLHIATLHLERD